MKKMLFFVLICSCLILSACSLPTPKATTTAATTTAAAATTVATTTAAPTTQATTATTATPTTVATTIATTAPTTTAATTVATGGTQVLAGTFQSYEMGDYMHINILGDDGKTYSFFVLKYPGVDIETLPVGQKVKVTWQNVDEYLNPPGDTINIDKVLGIELVG